MVFETFCNVNQKNKSSVLLENPVELQLLQMTSPFGGGGGGGGGDGCSFLCSCGQGPAKVLEGE